MLFMYFVLFLAGTGVGETGSAYLGAGLLLQEISNRLHTI